MFAQGTGSILRPGAPKGPAPGGPSAFLSYRQFQFSLDPPYPMGWRKLRLGSGEQGSSWLRHEFRA